MSQNTVMNKYKILNNIKSKLSIWWVRYLIIPLVLTGPAFFLVSYYTRQGVKNMFDAYLGADFVSFINKYSIIIFIISILLTYIWSVIHAILDNLTSPKDNLTIVHAVTLLESFERIVAEKAHRFTAELNDFRKKNSITTEQVFNTITKPDQQIIFIIYTLFAFLKCIDKNADFRVRLVEIKDNRPAGWFAFAPEHPYPQTDIEDLQHPDSTISACLKTRRMEIVESISAEVKKNNRKCVVTDDRNGSILCYPIYQAATKSWPYVISLYVDKEGFFKKSHKDFYRLILDQFALRIQLEHSLLQMKEILK